MLAAWASSSSEAALPSGRVPLSGPDLLRAHNMSKPLDLSSNQGTYARGSIYSGCWKAAPPIPSPLPPQPLQWIPLLGWNSLHETYNFYSEANEKSSGCWHFPWHCGRQELGQTWVAWLALILQVSMFFQKFLFWQTASHPSAAML